MSRQSPLKFFRRHLASALVLLLAAAAPAQETVLQYFNTSWREIEQRLPEVAEAGYTSLWLPPPMKGSSGAYSVGYDPFDRFDLGDRDQMGTVATRYGTKADLLRLVETAHRFGLRIVFDNVMAHNGGPLDDVPAGTMFPSIPGFVPEDFHLVRKSGGGWRKASDSVDYNDEWQVLNRNPFAWDIAHENPNTSFNPTGSAEGQDYPKWVGIRHPGKTALYPDTDLAGVTDANGVVFRPFADKEPWQDIGYQDSAAAVAKTVVGSPTSHPNWIVFQGGGATVGAGNGKFDFKDLNGNGQHDAGEPCEPFQDGGVDPTVTARQTADWGWENNRRDMGNPVAEDVNGMLIRSARWLIDQTGCDGFRLDAVKHVPSYFFGQQSGSKDGSSSGYLGNSQAQYNLTHGFTDWSNHRDSNYSTNDIRDDLMLFGEHLGAPPNPNDYMLAGMRIANDDFLNNVGGFNGIGSSMVDYDQPGKFTFGVDTGVMYCLSHDNNYMAGSERPAAHQYMLTRAGLPIVYTDGYNVASDYFPKPSYIPFLGQYGQNYVTGVLPVRRDFLRGDQWPRWSSQNFCAWEFRDFSENAGMSASDATTVLIMHARNYAGGQQMPNFAASFPSGHRLRNFSPYNGSFYVTVGNDGRLRGDGDSNPVIVPQAGFFAFSYDVPDVPAVFSGSTTVRPIEIYEGSTKAATIQVARKDGKNGDPGYAYNATIPVVRSGTNLRFVARADGSATNILMKLDGGVDINGHLGGSFTVGRDNRPGSARDAFLGYEQMHFVQRVTEKFAAQAVERDTIGSPGAETWQYTVGTPGVTKNDGTNQGIDTDTSTADWVYHNPTADQLTAGQPQMAPAAASATNQAVTFWVKVGYKADAITNAWLYYTTDGTSYPEGSAGVGRGSTKVVALGTSTDGPAEGGGTPVWFRGTMPAQTAGTVVRYKIGVHKLNAADRFPDTYDQVEKKKRMETLFDIAGFDATAAKVYLHNDLGASTTGLKEGFHLLRSRAFLKRDGKASLFKTQTQTFYYDTQRPTGTVLFPTENSTIGGSTYGFVVLTDASVTDVQFNILDTNAGNDSAANGNGAGNWAAAKEVTPSQLGSTGFSREWRFDFKGIPTSGAAIVNVRLREVSSAASNTLDDTAGWFTTLARTVNTGYPVNYRIQFPTTDGTVVGSNYIGKVYFDKSLGFSGGNPIPPAQIVSEFAITADGVAISPASYQFIRDETGSESALAFTFPNLYNGNPDDLHEVRATFVRGDISLTDTRLVKASPGAIADSDGDTLPDYWELQYRIDTNNPDGDEGADGDRDGDGISNVLEFLNDTNPTDGTDFALAPTPALLPAGASWKLAFRAIPNRRYQVQWSADLTGWSNAGSSFAVSAIEAAHEWTEPTPVPGRRFYRVMISLP